MDDFFDWLEHKGKGAVFAFEAAVVFGMTFLFSYLIIF